MSFFISDVLFVKHHSEDLIQRVNFVMPIADALKDAAIIQQEIYSQILNLSTNVNKMKVLLHALGTDNAKFAFYNELKTSNPNLVEDLEQKGERDLVMVNICQHNTVQCKTTEAYLCHRIQNLTSYSVAEPSFQSKLHWL